MAQTFNNGEQLGSIRTVLNDNADEINTLQASKASVDNPAFTGQASFADGTAAAPSVTNTGDLNAGLFFPAADNVAVATAGTERMRVDSSGNVGIGTSSPGAPVHVISASTTGPTIRLQNAGSSIAAADVTMGTIEFYSNDASVSATGVFGKIGVYSDAAFTGGAGNDAYMALFTNADSTLAERVRITSSGNLGIGTTSPLAKVHSQVNTFTTADMVAYKAYNNQAVGVYANFQNSATGTAITDGFLIGIGDAEDAVLHNQEATNMIFSTSATERMRIDSVGRVGIGTSSPAKTLTVSTADQASARVRIVNTSGRTYDIVSGVDGLFQSGFSIFDVTSAATRLTIDASGNVGIGNTSPVTPLHVTGASITTGVTYLAQPAQTSKAAAATLTIAELLTGIIQYTGAAATLTLPTGTLIEGGLPATFPTDMSFDVSFINTGAALLTIGTATSLTLVGTMTVATGTSGLLRFRKTAANTYTVYRIS